MYRETLLCVLRASSWTIWRHWTQHDGDEKQPTCMWGRKKIKTNDPVQWFNWITVLSEAGWNNWHWKMYSSNVVSLLLCKLAINWLIFLHICSLFKTAQVRFCGSFPRKNPSSSCYLQFNVQGVCLVTWVTSPQALRPQIHKVLSLKPNLILSPNKISFTDLLNHTSGPQFLFSWTWMSITSLIWTFTKKE